LPIGPIAPIAPIANPAPPVNLFATMQSGPSPIAQAPPLHGENRPSASTLLEAETPSRSEVVAKSAPVSPLIVVTPDREMTPQPLPDTAVTPITPSAFDDIQKTPPPAAAPAPAPAPPPAVLPSILPSDPVLALSHRKGGPPLLHPVESKPMPASEQQVSVKPHKPPSSRSDHSRILPSVIVDVSSEYVSLVDRVLAGPDEEAETDLLRAGGYAMPAIMARFPGPISIEPERLATGPLPRVAECGPIIRLVASQRRTALPFVLSHIEADVERRFWATYLLTELVYPDAIDAAVARAFDDDDLVRRAARAAVRALAESHPQPVIDRLGDVAKGENEHQLRRIRAVEALGEAREPLAIGVLLPLMGSGTPEVVAAVRAALVTITGQDFGLDAGKWSAWWETNKPRHRLEWLIDALMHDQRALRGAACDELRTITKEYFAYYDDLPKRERERAQARYREWWDKEGKVRFSRASTRGA
jgi:hypothetical protein